MKDSPVTIKISRLTAVDNAVLSQINVLLLQLSPELSPLTPGQLEAVVQNPANTIHIAIDEAKNAVVGMATVVTEHQLAGTKCWVEDVVVADGYRGRGIGKLLVKAAVAGAPEDAKSINLTSNPSRKAAYQLYESLGFEVRDTIVFRRAR